MLSFFIVILVRAFALDPIGSAVDQAQALALQKNRVEACAVLQRALQVSPVGPRGRAKLNDSLAQISKVFFTDKAQKAYESGQSLMWENPDLALTQFKSALELEDGNILILGSIARVLLIKQDCEGALASALSAQKIHPYDADSSGLELKALACAQRFEQVRERVKSLPGLDKWQDSFVQYILMLEWVQQMAWRKVYDSALKLTQEHPGFPEGFYFLTRAGAELNKDVEPASQKYVSICKALTIRERKRYALEPRLCANLKEVENELAKKTLEI